MGFEVCVCALVCESKRRAEDITLQLQYVRLGAKVFLRGV